MPDKLDLKFDDLVSSRRQLQEFCSAHHSSLIRFKDGISFKLCLNEPSLGPKARHLSSTATCIESLLDCPQADTTETITIADKFSLSAMKRPQDDWLSDDSAGIYCRCRTLPLIVYQLSTYQKEYYLHLHAILSQMKNDPSRLATGEASGDDRDNWYPPNAYHTYWTLYLLHAIEEKFPNQFNSLCAKLKRDNLDVGRLREEMLTWAQQAAGYQIALHSSESSTLDSDQLAWALAIVLKFDRDFQANLAKQDFIRYGFRCLFEHQTTADNWRTGAPLFHFLKSGNAYCYIFETFSILLKGALTDRKEGLFLRQLLRPYADNLLRLWGYAKSTRIPLSNDGNAFGWSSGHRPNPKEPESWATASVYSFSQCLRRLVGIWTREAAAAELMVETYHHPDEASVQMLRDRGDTWTEGLTAAGQLITLFVNSARYFGSGSSLEPDSQPIDERQARAAILFGPPGTSKTTLSRNVAKAIGWDYVELHASDFVAEGLPNVQRTADRIFDELMQLDRTVILFDEIDELVRAREKEPDAFGRFLTTSMLPKLAELWKGRKVIYFVATNYIQFFDPAITRAQRFDALVNVSPPSFKRKIQRLKSLLKDNYKTIVVKLRRTHVEKAIREVANHPELMTGTNDSNSELPTSCNLAKFLLMRWDQLNELATIITKDQVDDKVLTLTPELLTRVLAKLSDPSLKTREPFIDYMKSGQYEQHDFSKVSIWSVQGDVPAKVEKVLVKSKEGLYWYVSQAGFDDFSALPCPYKIVAPGLIEILK